MRFCVVTACFSALGGCGLTHEDVTPTREGDGGEAPGAAGDRSSIGGGNAAGDSGAAGAGAAAGPPDRATGGFTGGSGVGAGGVAPEGSVPIRFEGKPGTPALATAEDIGMSGVATIDGTAPRANLTSSARELCVETELASEQDDVQLFLKLGRYDASAHGVTGFAFDLTVEPELTPTRFWVAATYIDYSANFQGQLAPRTTHHAFHFEDLSYDSDAGHVILDSDYQQRLTTLAWDIEGTGVRSPTKFCVANLVALRD